MHSYDQSIITDSSTRCKFGFPAVFCCDRDELTRIPTDGTADDLVITLSPETWAELLAGKTTFSTAEDDGVISTSGDLTRIKRFLASFDHPSFI